MTYLQLNTEKQGVLESEIGDLIKIGQHPGRFSSECADSIHMQGKGLGLHERHGREL
jgi:hypothetical protein